MGIPVSILVFGIVIVLTIILRSLSARLSIPSLIGFILLGFLFRWADPHSNYLSREVIGTFDYLAEIGVIALLFRVGLESNLRGLLSQIRKAGVIGTSNVLLSGVLGFATAKMMMGWDLVPSLFIGAALTATSVGVSVTIWRDAGALSSATGELLVDVAEMDDISGIMLMALLVSLAPSLRGGFTLAVFNSGAAALGILLLKLLGFGLVCLIFSLFIEPSITRSFRALKRPVEPTLLITGFGIIIAALAGFLGFSFALGAFFAGLAFSRDPQAVRLDSSFEFIYELFTPFFFIGIGLHVLPASIGPALAPGALLLIAAAAGKILGTGIPSLWFAGWKESLLLGVSMVPRAEIAMVIIQKGHDLGGWAMPEAAFGSMILVALMSCLLSPLILRNLMKRWPQPAHSNR